MGLGVTACTAAVGVGSGAGGGVGWAWMGVGKVECARWSVLVGVRHHWMGHGVAIGWVGLGGPGRSGAEGKSWVRVGQGLREAGWGRVVVRVGVGGGGAAGSGSLLRCSVIPTQGAVGSGTIGRNERNESCTNFGGSDLHVIAIISQRRDCVPSYAAAVESVRRCRPSVNGRCEWEVRMGGVDMWCK